MYEYENQESKNCIIWKSLLENSFFDFVLKLFNKQTSFIGKIQLSSNNFQNVVDSVRLPAINVIILNSQHLKIYLKPKFVKINN